MPAKLKEDVRSRLAEILDLSEISQACRPFEQSRALTKDKSVGRYPGD
ncbi:hypothetical protein O3W52_04260 [Ensifer psoraleae]|uniref:Transposase n=1 Tax=Sinorhizobium psoraleae TaxID=520838 RepID=A0ABT4KBH2_9HYPH|nr:hypothetical protein [Sinorhizobium psoraleae]